MVVGRKHTVPGNVEILMIVASLLVPCESFSQRISHVDFEVIGGSVKISYDIDDCAGDASYDVRVMLGKDGELTTINRGLKGDIENVSCGSSKSIIWDVLSEREELKGNVYFTVEVYRTHSIGDIESKTPLDPKPWTRRSWKADKGYVGGSIGIFAPYKAYSGVPQSLTETAPFLNASIAYLPSLLLGVSSTVYIYGDAENRHDLISWKTWGVMIGPLISLPIGNVIKWEVRPQIGYSATSIRSDMPQPDSLNVRRGGVACNIGTGLRLNIGKRTCYLLNVEYLSAPIRFDDYSIEAEPGMLGASFGVAFRFY